MPAKASALTWQFDARRARRKKRVKVTVSRPFRNGRLAWACQFEMTGIVQELENFKIYGSDALQALVLSLSYLRSSLTRLEKKGYELLLVDSDEPLAPHIYFDAFKGKA
jgi:hypothetical protein